MYFCVCWEEDLIRGYHESDGYSYFEDNVYSFYFVNARDKEEATEKYLEKQFDDIYNCNDRDEYECNLWDCSIMREFISYSRFGDDTLQFATNYEAITKLSNDIHDRYIELILLDNGLKIHVEKDEFSYSTPGDDERYVDILCEEYKPERLLVLLNQDEKKKAFVDFCKYEVAVIEMQEI